MKKAIVTSLVVLLLNSAGGFVFAQTDARAAEKDFTPAYVTPGSTAIVRED